MTLLSYMWFLGYLKVSCVQWKVWINDSKSYWYLNAMKKLFDFAFVVKSKVLIHLSIILVIIPKKQTKTAWNYHLFERFDIYFNFTPALISVTLWITSLNKSCRVIWRNNFRLRWWDLKCLNRWSYGRNNFLLWR